GIDTGWSFATGAPTGLVKDPWNIRLVPHYWLGVFFVLTHLAAGTRVVIMAHGVSKAFADQFMVGSAVVAGGVATVIMLGRCGMVAQFILNAPNKPAHRIHNYHYACAMDASHADAGGSCLTKASSSLVCRVAQNGPDS